MKDINKIIWPEIRGWASTWNNYLCSGFLGVDLRVERMGSPWNNHPKIKGILPFDIIWESGRCQRIWYDISDFSRHYYENAIKGNDLYFKIQLHKKDLHYDRMHPIGQIASRTNFHEMLPKLKAIREKQEFTYDVIGIFRATNYDIRTKAVEIVKSQPWRSLVGMAYFRNRPPISEALAHGKLNYEEHLKHQCSSKICLDFPGVGGEWSWRFTEILGMGCFCLRTEPLHICPGESQNCWGEVKRDLSDLTEKIDYYLANEKARNEIAKNGTKYYEDYLSPMAQAKYLLDIARENQ